MKYKIDQEAFKKYLEKELNMAVTAEEACFTGKQYEEAMRHRERRYVLGNLLLMMEGDEHFPPVTVDAGGFVKPMTNIRAAVENMSDEELTDALSRFHTIMDGKLVDCDNVSCLLECPGYDSDDCKCETGIKGYMLREAE